jgi:hypothetical protein
MQLALKGVNKPIKEEVEKVRHAVTLSLGSAVYVIALNCWYCCMPECSVFVYT